MRLVPFTNTKLKKIVNVYQLEFTNGKSPGIGDFLRGSFSFMQVAQLLNLEFDIDISNHPISKYIQNNLLKWCRSFWLTKKLKNWKIKAPIVYILQLFHNKRKLLCIYLNVAITFWVFFFH